MTPTNRDELIALMARADLVTKFSDYADDTEWSTHWQWYRDGLPYPDSCVHYSNLALAVSRASASLDAMIKAGLAVVVVSSDPEGISATYEDAVRELDRAYRSTRRAGVSGQTIDACFRAEFAQAIAAYRAVIAAGRIDGGTT